MRFPYRTFKGVNIDDMYYINPISIYNAMAVFKIIPIIKDNEEPDIFKICENIESNDILDIVLSAEFGVTTMHKRVCVNVDKNPKKCYITLVVDSFGISTTEIDDSVCRPRDVYMFDMIEPCNVGPYNGTLIIKGGKMDLDDYKSRSGVQPGFINHDNLIWDKAYSIHAVFAGKITSYNDNKVNRLVNIIMNKLETYIKEYGDNNFNQMASIDFGRIMSIHVYNDSISISSIIYLKRIGTTNIEYISTDGKVIIAENTEQLNSPKDAGEIFTNITNMISTMDSIAVSERIDYVSHSDLHGKIYVTLRNKYNILRMLEGGNVELLLCDKSTKMFKFDFKLSMKLTGKIHSTFKDTNLYFSGVRLYSNRQYLREVRKLKEKKVNKLQDDNIIIGSYKIPYNQTVKDMQSIIDDIKANFPDYNMIYEFLSKDRDYIFTLRKKK